MSRTLAIFLDKPERCGAYRPYILEALSNSGYQILVVLLRGDKKKCRLSFDFPTITLFPSEEKINALSAISRIRSVFLNYDIGLVWVQRYRLWKYLSLFKKYVAPFKFGLLFHVVNSGYFRAPFRRLSLKFLADQTERWVVNSSSLKTEIENLVKGDLAKVKVIWNGIDLKRFEIEASPRALRSRFDLPQEGFIIGMIARFRKEKDQEGLLQAFSLIKDRSDKLYLVLAGGGPKEERLRSMIHLMNLEERVRIMGWIPSEEVPYLLKAFDLYVHASRREGMPNAVLEAMAAGLPVIATEAPGLPDIFASKKKFGELIPQGEYKALAEAIWNFYKTSSRSRKVLGEAAKARVKEAFTIEKMSQEFVKAFQELESEVFGV